MQTLSLSLSQSLGVGLGVCTHKQKQPRRRKIVCISGGGAGEDAARRRMQWQTSCSVISATAAAAAEDEEAGATRGGSSSSSSSGRILRVAYQGSPGSFGEAAAERASERGRCEAVACEEPEGAFHAVELWLADRAVLALENTLGGTIHRNYDLLLRHRLHVVAELQLRERQCLLGLPGARLGRIRRVLSHPQALAQCEATLDALLPPGAARHAFADPAAAARHVAELRLRDTGVVAGARAAELYGLAVLAGDVHDDPVNVTRFAVLAREPAVARRGRGRFKTSIAFAFPLFSGGGLFKVLSALAFRRISVVKIESRPHQRRAVRVVQEEAAQESVGSVSRRFDYMFYVDLEASLAEPRAQHALADILEFTSFMRVLGSYPMDTSPISVPVSPTDADSSSATV